MVTVVFLQGRGVLVIGNFHFFFLIGNEKNHTKSKREMTKNYEQSFECTKYE